MSGQAGETDAARTSGQRIAFIVSVCVLVLLALWTLTYFLIALVWAGILAIAVWPLYRRLRQRFGAGRYLLPAICTLAVTVVFLLPVVAAAIQAGQDLHILREWLRQSEPVGLARPAWLSSVPFVSAPLERWWSQHLAHPGWSADLLHQLNNHDILGTGRLIGIALLHRAVLFVCALLTLFFLLRDGEMFGSRLLLLARRFLGSDGEAMAAEIVRAVHGITAGLVLVGLAIGLLMGVAYALTGVPHPALMGALTAVGAMIPFAAPVVFTLAALMILVQGAIVGALVIIGLGVALTFIADHLVRPVLIGDATHLPFPLVLFGILGGVEAWGLLGLFVGPAILTVLVMLWRQWTEPGGNDAVPAAGQPTEHSQPDRAG
ncbi:MAG: AI-2E family transporter [Acetobacteraceae bacterium]